MKKLFLLSLLSILSIFMLNAQTKQRPNIVLIMADDMGYSDLGCYGSEIPTPKEHQYMYWEHFGNRVVRKGDWKGVKHEREDKWELYNLRTDNTELNNVATKEPEILNDLIAHWDQWAKDKFVLPKRANK